MSDQIGKFLDEEWRHGSWEYLNDVPHCACGEEIRGDDYLGRALDEHRVRAALAAAGVAPQPEPEYEYSWEGADDEGDDWIMDEWFATVAGAERYADSRMGNWVRTDNGKLIRRVKAGAWEPVPNQSDGGRDE